MNADWAPIGRQPSDQANRLGLWVCQNKGSYHALSSSLVIITHPLNCPFSGTTRVSRYQKGKTSLDFTEARYSEWQWHQLGHMQVCTSLQTDNHASIPPLVFYRPDALPAAQPTASKHWRWIITFCDYYSAHNWYSFYCTMDVEGRRLSQPRLCSKGAQPVP